MDTIDRKFLALRTGSVCGKVAEAATLTTHALNHFSGGPGTNKPQGSALPYFTKTLWKCCSRPHRGSPARTRSTDQEWFGAACAFLRWCPSYASLCRKQLRMNWTGRRCSCSAASLLSPTRVARVSRLIGTFDTTAKSWDWQVYW